MLKPKISRYAGVFDDEDLKTRISRWVGMICLAIGSGDVRTALYNIWDEINENAFVHGYNTAIKEMNAQPGYNPGAEGERYREGMICRVCKVGKIARCGKRPAQFVDARNPLVRRYICIGGKC
jgi:hypothetical protein